MVERLGTLARTHTCGALTAADVGADVVLLGWVHRVRDLGALVFVDLRDRHGLTQLTARDDEALVEAAKRVRPEFVVAALGRVERRAPETVNAKMPTGEVEVVLRELRVLIEAKTPPFQIAEDASASDETRGCATATWTFAGRGCRQNLQLRHRVLLAVRRYFDERGFLGDRDARPHQVHARGRARLPRAEPRAPGRVLRAAAVAADLQADPDDRGHGPLLPDRASASATRTCGPTASPSSRRSTSRCRSRPRTSSSSIDRGADPRDVRDGGPRRCRRRSAGCPTPRRWRATARTSRTCASACAIEDLSAVFADSTFGVFRDAVASGGAVRGIVVPGGASSSRKEIDGLVEQAKQLGAAGLAWARASESAVQASILKAAGEATLRAALGAAGAAPPDLLLMASGEPASRVEGARPAPPGGRAGRPAG